MTSVQSTIFFGVLSGVVAGYSLFFLTSVFYKIVLPWYRKITYRGVDISGTWVFESSDYFRRQIQMELTQAADKIQGTSVHTKLTSEASQNEQKRYSNRSYSSDAVRSFIVKGSVVNRILTIHGRVDDNSRIGAITGLFEIVGDGQIMEGVGAAYSATEKIIGASNFTARRMNKI